MHLAREGGADGVRPQDEVLEQDLRLGTPHQGEHRAVRLHAIHEELYPVAGGGGASGNRAQARQHRGGQRSPRVEPAGLGERRIGHVGHPFAGVRLARRAMTTTAAAEQFTRIGRHGRDLIGGQGDSLAPSRMYRPRISVRISFRAHRHNDNATRAGRTSLVTSSDDPDRSAATHAAFRRTG